VECVRTTADDVACRGEGKKGKCKGFEPAV
jgi:hypothetical protein